MNNLLISSVGIVALVVIVPLLLVMILLLIATRFKKCPSDKIMVVYGKVSSNKDGTHRSAKCLHGGVSFIVPLFQAYEFLDLTPISIAVDLKSALSRQNIRIDVPSIFTVTHDNLFSSSNSSFSSLSVLTSFLFIPLLRPHCSRYSIIVCSGISSQP